MKNVMKANINYNRIHKWKNARKSETEGTNSNRELIPESLRSP
jgi:hypothetical protein